MTFILAGLAHLVLGEEKRRPAHNAASFDPGRMARTFNAEIASGLIFTLSALPVFWVPDGVFSYLRFDLWYGVFVVFLLVSRFGARGPRRGLPV